MINKKITTEILKLIKIISILRSPEGCPWDKKQTPETLKPYLLEEVYELLEAIDKEKPAEIRDELGDLLLQVVFLAQIYSERKQFGLVEVADALNNKLIRRHPHVFADTSREEHAQLWEEIKQQERTAQGASHKLADRIPNNLPALKKATKVAKKLPLEKPTKQILKIIDKYSDLSQILKEQNPVQNKLKNTLGEIFFFTTQLAASLQIDAEDLLRQKTMHVITKIDTKKECSSGHELQSS
jgi:MazG family protein